MCDYSVVASSTRKGRVGDHLEARLFGGVIAFGEIGGLPDQATCLLPGTIARLEIPEESMRKLGVRSSEMARFEQLPKSEPHFRDGFRLAVNGTFILNQALPVGLRLEIEEIPAEVQPERSQPAAQPRQETSAAHRRRPLRTSVRNTVAAAVTAAIMFVIGH